MVSVLQDTAEVHITVIDVNDNEPKFCNSSYTFYTKEGTLIVIYVLQEQEKSHIYQNVYCDGSTKPVKTARSDHF